MLWTRRERQRNVMHSSSCVCACNRHATPQSHTQSHTPKNSYLKTPELQRLCAALVAFGKGAPVAAKEGQAKGVSVPPGVRALLEALCDEG